MKNYSAKSIFGTILGISLLASCIKKDPDFKSAFKDINPDNWTMTYTMKTNNEGKILPAVTNVPVNPQTLKPVTRPVLPPIGYVRPDSSRIK